MSSSSAKCPSPVDRVVPYLHVADVERSIAFYAFLGFREEDRYHGASGNVVWASVRNRMPNGATPEVFFALADAPVIPEQQAVLLYMYSKNVRALRAHLLECGLHDGGEYRGQCGPNNGRSIVFEVRRPAYMQNGELRVADPDGHCLLIGQL